MYDIWDNIPVRCPSIVSIIEHPSPSLALPCLLFLFVRCQPARSFLLLVESRDRGRRANPDSRWQSRCHLDKALLWIVVQWEFVKREISRWLEPMVSGELTAASAHRSKVHLTTTSPLQPLVLLLLLLMLVARARLLSLFLQSRPTRSLSS